MKEGSLLNIQQHIKFVLKTSHPVLDKKSVILKQSWYNSLRFHLMFVAFSKVKGNICFWKASILGVY